MTIFNLKIFQMATVINIFVATLVVSLVSLVGILFLFVREKLIKRVAMVLVAFASGSLIGGAFFHLIPESLKRNEDWALLVVVVGILSFLVLEKFLCWRHCHEELCDLYGFVYLNLIGDGIHNFLDGMIIAGSFLVSAEMGVVTTIVILSHEVPQELGDFWVLIYAGFTKARALLFNLLSALTAVLGGMFAYFYSMYIHDLRSMLLPFAAGGFIYIALVDLIPELHKRRKPKEAWLQFMFIGLGVVALWLSTMIYDY